MVLFRGADITDLAWQDFQTACETFRDIICSHGGSFSNYYEQIIDQILETFGSIHVGGLCRVSILKVMKVMALTCPLTSQFTITGAKTAFFEVLTVHVGDDFVVTEAGLKYLEVLAFLPLQLMQRKSEQGSCPVRITTD